MVSTSSPSSDIWTHMEIYIIPKDGTAVASGHEKKRKSNFTGSTVKLKL
jgi:hypothetical protein